MNRAKARHIWIEFIFIFIAGIATIELFMDFNRPHYYNLLPLLPITYIVISIMCSKVYTLIPDNLGATLIIILFFCRMVLSPLLMTWGQYSVTLKLNIDQNTPWAIFLVCYEAVVVFLCITYKMQNFGCNNLTLENFVLNRKKEKIYGLLVCVMLMLLIACIKTVPQLMDIYRSIFEITDEHFSNYEDAYIIAEFSTNFANKLALVTGNYLMRATLVVVPAFIIVVLSNNKHRKFNKFFSLLVCTTPLFFIGGAIAKSLIYMISLFLLRTYMFPTKQINTKIMRVILIGVIIVIAWWIYNFTTSSSMSKNGFSYFSSKFSAYFSGVNVVSGVFNLPDEIKYKFRYFIYDYLSTFPYGTTLFGISYETVQPFFNSYNYSIGQIPPTIAMGYYYFGPILAPIYSIVFANVAYNSGEKIAYIENPFGRIRMILTSVYFAMGIVMYNIDIIYTELFTLLIPMYFMEKCVSQTN